MIYVLDLAFIVIGVIALLLWPIAIIVWFVMATIFFMGITIYEESKTFEDYAYLFLIWFLAPIVFWWSL